VPHLLADIKDTYDDDSNRSYTELFRRLCEVDLLHLDDLGAEKPTEWVLEQLYSIVNERWQNERSIVVTSNPGIDELRAQIGQRTVSRLEEITDGAIPLMGRDLRTTSSP
jgi:DNA replication protein DnaC